MIYILVFFYNISKCLFCKKKIIINIDNRCIFRLCVSDEFCYLILYRKERYVFVVFFFIVFLKKSIIKDICL